jgi:UDP-glucuronate decarboxylase
VRTLITGGTGFVGKSLLEIAQSQDLLGSITLCARNFPKNLPTNVDFVSWNLLEPANLSPDFDVIIHAATPSVVSQGALRNTYDNVVSTMSNLISFIEFHPKPPRVLFASSGAVYGETADSVIKIQETWIDFAASSNLASPYGLGKLEAERLLGDAHLAGKCQAIIARLFTFSGAYLPLDQHFAIGNFVGQAIEHKKITVRSDGQSIRSYLDSLDMASWLITAALHASGDTPLHIGSENSISVSLLAQLVAEIAEYRYQQTVPIEILGQNSSIDGVKSYVPSTQLTRDELGVSETVNLRDSIHKMFENFDH